MATKKVKIRYIKANDYKVVLSTGIYGGVGSNGLINANFFVDRTVIPQSEEFEIDENGKKVGEPKREKDGDAVREVQFGTLFDINTAKSFVKWLSERIEEYEEKQEDNL